MPYQTIGKYASRSGVSRKTDFKRPVTFFDRVRFVGGNSTMEILGGVLSGDISADLLTLGTLDADRIAVGSLDADRITTGTITAQQLVLGSGGNLVQDPSFELTNTLSAVHSSFGNGGSWGTGTANRSGARSINYNPTGQTSNGAVYLNSAAGTDLVNHPAAHEGEKIYLSAWARGHTGSGPWNKTAVIVSWRDEELNILSSDAGPWTTMTTSWQQLEVQSTAPAGATHCILQLWVQNDGNDDLILFDDCYARRMIGSLVIDGQAIDIERLLNPVEVKAEYDFGNTGSKAFVTWNTGATTTYTVPSWAGEVTYIATGMGSMLGAIATDGHFQVRIYNGSTAKGDEGIVNIMTDFNHKGGTNIVAFSETLAAPGSTVTTNVRGYHSFGNTNRDMAMRLTTTYIGLR